MAGSWSHMTTDDGKLRETESFHGMLEDGGDVYEAAEECFGMIWWMAKEIDRLLNEGQPLAPDRTDLSLIISTAVHNYKTGLVLGGVQTEAEVLAERARDGE